MVTGYDITQEPTPHTAASGSLTLERGLAALPSCPLKDNEEMPKVFDSESDMMQCRETLPPPW